MKRFVFVLFVFILLLLFIPAKGANAACIDSGGTCSKDTYSCCDTNYYCKASPNSGFSGSVIGNCVLKDTNYKPGNEILPKDAVRVKVPLNIPCTPKGSGNDIYYDCQTGLGINIETNAAGFTKSMFQIVLSLSGGLALILILIAGYQLIIARGNAEKIQQAKDRLTSAIVGLLFIIFSLVILEVIGVDILKIPGFS
ncbi:pilin [Patescibacteria group bacterium]|nr:pilin [Patescibacteria group bacterium]